MSYKRDFNPKSSVPPTRSSGEEVADRFEGYVYSASEGEDPDEEGKRIILAVNVAMATSRPLFLRGAPGCGKSSLAQDVARQLGWSYYSEVITSRTQAQDLLWKLDAVARLADAQANRPTTPLARYVVPGVLWWAFAPTSAAWRGLTRQEAEELGLSRLPPPGTEGDKKDRAVVLLDEIDKAEPDVPNDLLEPLGLLRFPSPTKEAPIAVPADRAPLIVITSNDERELPLAFLRRCIVLELKRPSKERLFCIARAHCSKADDALLERVYERFVELGMQAERENLRAPGTAEFIDTVKACIKLELTGASPEWELLAQVTLWKHPESEVRSE